MKKIKISNENDSQSEKKIETKISLNKKEKVYYKEINLKQTLN